MEKQEENELLNTLKSIDGTLKRIEQSLVGEKRDSTPKDDGEYLEKAVRTAIHDTFQE